ncbi:kinase-like domain-containing protein [Protomyces lactucae-debilis]|uniref:Kinase-like domain-containing protein n=1 Tax=Protomyces lactucae-debilis TaxID=2754530 RepID=A0A1Y2FV48_PROLT|nr:kinase-like domain-containing protein [Protomyces lactucae-debilis]ORY87880.1 kinase-like domain-containing protein [Protomyces lactucae-debilis]
MIECIDATRLQLSSNSTNSPTKTTSNSLTLALLCAVQCDGPSRAQAKRLVRRPVGPPSSFKSQNANIHSRTPQGQQISYDRSNRRITTTMRATSRRPSFEHGQRTSSRELCPLCQQPLRADAQDVGSNASYVHPEYFGYLATCLEQEESVSDERDAEDSTFDFSDHIRPSAFNDGYFDRFFVVEGLLGRGGRGEVSKVRHVLEDCDLGTFALKRCSVGDSHAWLTKMLREVQSLKFQHENLVRYNHVWLEHAQLSLQGPRIPVLHILQEHCNGGDLEAYVLRRCGKVEPTVQELKARHRRQSRGEMAEETLGGMTMDIIFSIFKDLVAGMAILHEQDVIHRDLKPSNCLLDFRDDTRAPLPRAVVSDFGEAQFGLSNNADARKGGTGTLLYTAPEIVRGEPWTQAADIFSLGMILYFMTHEGQLPYLTPESDFNQLRTEIAEFAGYDSDRRQPHKELDLLLSKLLAPHALNRPTCKDLLSLVQSSQRPWSTSSTIADIALPSTGLRRLSSLPGGRPAALQHDPVQPQTTHATEKSLSTVGPGEKLALLEPQVSASSLTPSKLFQNLFPLVLVIHFALVSTRCSPDAVSTIGLVLLAASVGVLTLCRQRGMSATQICALMTALFILFCYMLPSRLLCV